MFIGFLLKDEGIQADWVVMSISRSFLRVSRSILVFFVRGYYHLRRKARFICS